MPDRMRDARGRFLPGYVRAKPRSAGAQPGPTAGPPTAALTHNSRVAPGEPDWGDVDKSRLPRAAFADQGDPSRKSTWKFPHHWVKGGGDLDENGVYTSGTMYLHRGGLNAAWSAAQGGRSGQKASQAVRDHLAAHRRSLGLTGAAPQPTAYHVDHDAREIYLYGDVGPEIDDEQVVRDVKAFGRKGFTVHINSRGGYVYQAMAIYHALRDAPGKVRVVVDGVAASAASFIAMAGDVRTIRQGAFLMVHGSSLLAIGNHRTIQRAADYIRKLDDEIAGIYAYRSGRPLAEVRNWMDQETWFAGREAVAVGLADEAEEIEPAPTDHMDLSIFTRVPEALGGPSPAREEAPDETLRRRVAAFLGFDEHTIGASPRRSEAPPPQAHKETNMDFNAWLKDHGFDDPEALTDEQASTLKAQYEAEQAAEGDPPKTGAGEMPTAAVPQGLTAERKAEADELRRRAAIKEACKGHDEIAAKAIEEGWDLERTKTELELARLRDSRPEAPAIHAGGGEPTATALEAAVQMSAGEDTAALEKEYQEQTLDAADRFRSMRLRDLISTCCRMEGQPVPAIGASPGEWAQAAFSTTSLPGILGDSARKTMERAYRAFPGAADRLARVLSAADFKQHTGYRLTGAFDLDEVGPDGELKHVTVGEDSFTYQVTTRGAMFGLTRQMLINDDMGALLAIPRKFGRGAARTKEEMLWTLVLANTGSYFAAGNKNYKTGATSALGYSGLGVAEQTLAEQTDQDGKPILVVGRYLVVPPALAGDAEDLYRSRLVVSGNTSKTPDTNRFASKYEPIVVPYLGNTNFHASASSKAWYLWGDPQDVALFGIAYLRGRQTPVIEEVGVQPDILGRAWRGYIDVGVCQVDHRGGVKMKGE